MSDKNSESRKLPESSSPHPITAGSAPRDDWATGWPEENDPQPTPWLGHDTSSFALFGGREDPNETAAAPNRDMLESTEVEGDPLIALRRVARDSQAIIRRELDRRINLEDQNRELVRRNDRVEDDNEALRVRNQHLERTRQYAGDALVLAEQQRDLYRRERDLARNQSERLRLELDEPEEANRLREARQEEHEEAAHVVQDLQRSELSLRAELDSARTRANDLQTERDRLEDDREQLELERNHYETARNLERDQNQILQEQVAYLVTQLRAAQAVAVPPLFDAAPVVAVPVVAAPVIAAPVIAAPIIAAPVDAAHSSPASNDPAPVNPGSAAPPGGGSARVGGRGSGGRGASGRGGRGRRDRATATRIQPGRACKVEKSRKENDKT